MQSMVGRLPGVAPPIQKSNPDSYADTPFTDEITLIELPRKFSFPSIKAYNGTTDQDDHVAQYRQMMLAEALPNGSRETTMCKGFGSTMTRPSLQCIPTAISAFKRGLLPDRDLYKELTKYECKTMEDVLSRAWAQVKWEEDIASRAKAQQKKDPKMIRPDRTEPDEKPSQRPARDSGNRKRGRYQNRPIEKVEGMAVSTWPDISHLSVSRPKLINVLRQMGHQVKWPQKMKASDSFWNPGFWCDFHRDHSHKTEDCVALKIEFNELLRKGHLRELLSKKAKSHLSKETTENHLELQTRPRGSQAKTPAPRDGRNKFHGQGAGQSPLSSPRHPCYLAHCSELLGKKDTGRQYGSSCNIIFQAAYKDLGL
ncbi:hypothetical protein F2Q69_00012713 [Brassica cretica]|uniref:Uncharacterized protein n=1 Tax=Brassica cretica TaxID=69181 RepID=A0A8S9QQW4_BRACR|nr:hypothetical protein F2Q69_00012713 [Brassica cretica]